MITTYGYFQNNPNILKNNSSKGDTPTPIKDYKTPNYSAIGIYTYSDESKSHY
jgi:hypothetical protein